MPPPLPPPNIPAILLTSLPLYGQGQAWHLSRTLSSSRPHEPSGLVTGTAVFTPREPTAEGYAGECVYGEEGEMEVNGGVKLRFRRGYIWRFNEGKEAGGVSLWFIKPEPGVGSVGGVRGAEVDYLFHELEFLPSDEEDEEDGGEEAPRRNGADVRDFRAKGHHLCVEDVYDTEYLFRVRWVGKDVAKSRENGEGKDAGALEGKGQGEGKIGLDGGWEVEKWEVRHTVKGPKKDQRLWSVYTRDGGKDGG
jgi:hypothetical protein